MLRVDAEGARLTEELELLGELSDKTLLHLQCNCGQDTLSLAKHGCRVTGVDISDDAIGFASQLSKESGIEAEFERSDVLAWLPQAAAEGRRFDRVLCSYGTIGWVEDLDAYFRGIAGVLAPGGSFVLLEFHPLVWSYGFDSPGDPYFHPEPLDETQGVQDYVGRSGPGALTPSGWAEGVQDFANPQRAVSFQWTVADILNAVLAAGLDLGVVREYPHSNGCKLFENMPTLEGNRFGMPPGKPSMPLMFGLRAIRSV